MSTQLAIIPKTTTDERIIEMWLHEHSPKTVKAYKTDINQFLAIVRKPIREITLSDLQDYVDSLSACAKTTQARKIATVKSLFTFCLKTGYITLNPAEVIKTPKTRGKLNQRILTESQVSKMIALESNPRDHLILKLLYSAGLRVSELCNLKWEDCIERDNGLYQITVHGKGNKIRTILLNEETSKLLASWKLGKSETYVIFASHNKPINPSTVWRIVKKAAKLAGLPEDVSPHWLRHAHASHALDRGAPVSLVKETLGHESLATTSIYTHARPNDSSSLYLP